MLQNQLTPVRVITDMNLKEHFKETLTVALVNQGVEAEEETAFYLVNMLERFSHPENLFTPTAEGLRLLPLAILYAQALEAKDLDTRQTQLQRLGDIALLISGVFPGSLSRKLVDVDYYIGMGSGAFSCLSDMAQASPRLRYCQDIFTELAEKFKAFVDVLAEVGENSHLNPGHDTLRLYELWVKTGSRRAGEKLRMSGIEPIAHGMTWRCN